MSIKREAIYGELFTRLKAIQGFKTVSRVMKHYNDVPQAQQPALFVVQTPQIPSYETGRTVFWELRADLYLYVRAPAGQAPGPIINPLMDAVVDVFKPDNAMVNACTFGGLCHRIELGTIETDEGTLGEQAVAIIPVAMTLPGTPM